MTYINFAILNSHVKVIYLRFTKSTNFYVVKEKNLKWLYVPTYLSLYVRCVFFEAQKCLKRLLSESYILKSIKRIEVLPAEKFGNIYWL